MDFETGLMDSVIPFDCDGDFGPQQRARSNTWPCPRPDSFIEPGQVGPPIKDEVGGAQPGGGAQAGGAQGPLTPGGSAAAAGGGASAAAAGPSGLIPIKKNSSRRNAWGNLSYADLITQAISSAPDKRLTLSQIYEWMVQNVAYFKDKGDSNSSAGWKPLRGNFITTTAAAAAAGYRRRGGAAAAAFNNAGALIITTSERLAGHDNPASFRLLLPLFSARRRHDI
ncbi:unnamed protein product [Trichogramma brassicae]|uniref:Fork-head domain-containing protein n=1 Tax=Trichogramma brassicae TaxID=86971 RepID=A0A6H5IVQ4_9HYME|nr:unnamed protein product [Trichogramma brassicae]